jgi:hypothetical protein
MVPGGRLAMLSLALAAAGLVPSHPRAAALFANSVQIRLVEPYNPGLTEADAEVVFKHGLEDGSGYPLSVEEDAVRHAGVHRLQKVTGALGDYEDVVVTLL